MAVQSARQVTRRVLAGERAIAFSDVVASVSVEMEAGKIALAAGPHDPALPAAHAAMSKARRVRISALARIGQIDAANAQMETCATPETNVAHRRRLIIPDLDNVPEAVVRRADSTAAIFDQRIVRPEGTADSRTATFDQRIVGPATSSARDVTRRDDSAIGGSMCAF